MQRKRFRAERVKKFEKLLEKAKKRGISRERLEERIKVFGGIVWLSKWRRMSFEEKVGFAKKRYRVKKVSREVMEVLKELDKGKIDYTKIKGKEFVVALPWLYELSFSWVGTIRRNVSSALRRIGVWNKDVGRILERLSIDEYEQARGEAATTLGKIGVWNKDVAKILNRLSRDKDENIRIFVANVLGEIRVWDDVVGEILNRLSRDRIGSVRLCVVYALREIGVWNKDVAGMLKRLSKDPDPDRPVRESVLRSLKKIKIDENTRRRLIGNIEITNEIVKAARGYFRKLDYEKGMLVIDGLFRNRFDRKKFLKNEKYRKELLNLVKAMSVEKLREFVFGKRK